ncbi:MAG: 3'-5' exonuclease [Pseudomonadota bacterium]
MHCMVFDIETVPDVASGRRLLGLPDSLDDAGVYAAMASQREAKTGSDFMPLHLQRIVAISVALRTADEFRIWSLGTQDSDEAELIRRFFDGIERYTPDIVSWNGSGFDLPVLHYRSLVHGISAPRYWDNGDDNREFRFNNYQNRFHWRHIDLMDVLAGFQGRGRAPLDDIAVMLGLPGKLGMSGDKVYDAFLAGRLGDIRDYCETDVANTYLVYLHFERLRGRIDDVGLANEVQRVRRAIGEANGAHWQAYLAAWPEKSEH